VGFCPLAPYAHRMREPELLRLAIALARESVREGGGPFGALVAREGRVIAAGKNQVTLANDPTAHAEVVAIRAACAELASFSLEGCELFSSCEPCPMCLAASYWARVERVTFAATRADAAAAGFDDARIEREQALPADQRALPLVQLLHAEGAVAFQDWARLPDRRPY
jgi:guanine deaminase